MATNPRLPQAPREARLLVRQLLAFGISVGVGLAPLLGYIEVPFFKPLLGVLPPSERQLAIPISSIMMGIVAVAVQWYGSVATSARARRSLFPRILALVLGLTLVLVTIHVSVMTSIPVEGDQIAMILHGFLSPSCPECSGKSTAECIQAISFSPASIERCWGSHQVRVARMALTTTYLATMTSFGALVGLLVLDRSLKSRSFAA